MGYGGEFDCDEFKPGGSVGQMGHLEFLEVLHVTTLTWNGDAL